MIKINNMAKINKVEEIYWSCYRKIRDFISPIWYHFFGLKHHIIRTGLLPSSWYDVDTRLLYGNMELVKWFVENDMRVISEGAYQEEVERISNEKHDYKESELESWKDQYESQKQILEIYEWWKDYPRREKEIADALTNSVSIVDEFVKKNKKAEEGSVLHNSLLVKNGECKEYDNAKDDYWNKKEQLHKEEKEMLHKIVDLKDRMWS